MTDKTKKAFILFLKVAIPVLAAGTASVIFVVETADSASARAVGGLDEKMTEHFVGLEHLIEQQEVFRDKELTLKTEKEDLRYNSMVQTVEDISNKIQSFTELQGKRSKELNLKIHELDNRQIRIETRLEHLPGECLQP